MRKRIFEVIEVANEKDRISSLYDGFMLFTIIISIIPLCFKSQSMGFIYIEQITVIIFIVDYLLRWVTADLKIKNFKSRAFLIYPFTPMAIIDLFSILPSITILNKGFRLLKLFRLIRTFRVFKFIRYSKSISIILNVLKREKEVLLAVGYLALGYIVVALPAGVITGGYIDEIRKSRED